MQQTMKNIPYWVTLIIGIVTGLVLCTLIFYFSSEEKDLLASLSRAVYPMTAVTMVVHFQHLRAKGFENMRMSYGKTLAICSLACMIVLFLVSLLLYGWTPLLSLISSAICTVITVIIVLVLCGPKSKSPGRR